MANEDETEQGDDVPEKKKSKLGLIIGFILALALGGGGFFAAYSGMLGGAAPAEEADAHQEDATEVADLPAVAFVPLEPLIVSLGTSTDGRHLRFRGSLEVVPQYQTEVEQMTPRVLDVLNSYLRAIDLTTLDDPTSLIKLRAQMLRRIQLVTGDGRVRDLLITEFVLN